MCGEDYFHPDWSSSPPTGGEEQGAMEFEEWTLQEPFEDDDLPDFGDPEEDGEDWDEDDWFGTDDLLTLEDAIMLMDEDELLEWLLMDEQTEFTGRRQDSCGQSALLDWDEAA